MFLIRTQNNTSPRKMSKSLCVLMVATWVALSIIYYNIFNYEGTEYKYNELIKTRLSKLKMYNDSAAFLIDNPGCFIPNYAKTMKFKEASNFNYSCGLRTIFIKKISDHSIMFVVNMKRNLSCCYQFARRSNVPLKEDSQITYSSCLPFKNGTVAHLESEVIEVRCTKDILEKSNYLYKDAFIILKKINKSNNDKQTHRGWNVLVLGMDTMSRGRIYSSMPKTTSFLNSYNWLDYRGYHKVAYNTFPNLMAILTGRNISTIYKKCNPSMHECRNLMIWTKFREAGYFTAYGEDFLSLPDTFSNYGFKDPPVDHYMRPFFLTGERNFGNIVCAHKQTSATNMLNYALSFAEAYKNDNFFGLFWMNSHSHNKFNSPTLFDNKMVNFLEKLQQNGALNNTFIFFLSDHGIRYGKVRVTVESYYEERLPMLFMWVPLLFRQQYRDQFYNLQLNQGRLTSHLDLHMTLWHILRMSNQSINLTRSEACPSCEGLFEEVSPNRTCAGAHINEKWCTCHEMVRADAADDGTRNSLKLAITALQNKTKQIKTNTCTTCSLLNLKRVLRTHFYNVTDSNTRYYVLAFIMSPGDVGYETKIRKSADSYTIVQNTDTISEYNTKGSCVKNRNDRPYCVCLKVKNCEMTRNNNTL